MSRTRSKQPPSNSRLSMPKRYLIVPEFMFKPDPDFGNKAVIDILSRAGLRTFWFLFSQYKGRNNGDFSIAPAICDKYGISRTTARKGVAELAYLGLIVETRQGGLNKPSLFGLTWLGLDEEYSFKFDDGIEASATPMRCWMLQYRRLRTRHLCDEYERKLAADAARRANRQDTGKEKKAPHPWQLYEGVQTGGQGKLKKLA